MVLVNKLVKTNDQIYEFQNDMAEKDPQNGSLSPPNNTSHQKSNENEVSKERSDLSHEIPIEAMCSTSHQQ